jgi:excisionase family DNA binding protein
MPRRVSLPNNVPALFPPGDHRKTISLKELSELSGIAGPTLRDWLRRGTIGGAFQRKKGAKWRFRREALVAWWQELLQEHNVVPQNGHNLHQFSRVEHLELPQFDPVQEAYRRGFLDGVMHAKQQASEDLGPFIKPYPTSKEIATRIKADLGGKQKGQGG